jgi:hypothetical protein
MPESITTANVREALPAADAVERTRAAFERAGFDLGPVVGNSFSITAMPAAFTKMFKTKLSAESYELALHALPRDVASLIEAVTFTPPPDFGPTEY